MGALVSIAWWASVNSLRHYRRPYLRRKKPRCRPRPPSSLLYKFCVLAFAFALWLGSLWPEGTSAYSVALWAQESQRPTLQSSRLAPRRHLRIRARGRRLVAPGGCGVEGPWLARFDIRAGQTRHMCDREHKLRLLRSCEGCGRRCSNLVHEAGSRAVEP